MFRTLFKKEPVSDIPQRLYGTVMAHARNPVFYREFGVPDTVMGRFDMLSLHTYLFNRRMAAEEKPQAQDLSQEVFDLFVYDLERALRQIGIGDQTVPKRKKRLVHSYYGLIEDLDGPLNAGNKDMLESALLDRIFEKAKAANAPLLTAYVMDLDKHLQSQDYASIRRGEVNLPEPGQILANNPSNIVS